MDAVKKAIKKLRGQLRPKLLPASALDILVADWNSQYEKQQMWESDKITKRDANFEKARRVREANLKEQREIREAEERRQALIAETRMKNLKKAQRKLRRLRKQEK